MMIGRMVSTRKTRDDNEAAERRRLLLPLLLRPSSSARSCRIASATATTTRTTTVVLPPRMVLLHVLRLLLLLLSSNVPMCSCSSSTNDRAYPDLRSTKNEEGSDVRRGSRATASSPSSAFLRGGDETYYDDVEGRIVGGVPANCDIYAPGQCACINGMTVACGGTYVAPGIILTAAHCAPIYETCTIRCNRCNAISNSPEELEKQEVFTVREVINHPSYGEEGNGKAYDIALVQLNEATARKTPIVPLVFQGNEEPFAVGETLIVTGWGKTDPNMASSSSDILRQVDVEFIDNDQCRSYYGTSSITDDMMCAGYVEGGKDACQGDSGGPLWKLYPSIPDRPVQAGIVSWGNGCAKEKYPGVYAEIPYSEIKQWIESKVLELNGETALESMCFVQEGRLVGKCADDSGAAAAAPTVGTPPGGTGGTGGLQGQQTSIQGPPPGSFTPPSAGGPVVVPSLGGQQQQASSSSAGGIAASGFSTSTSSQQGGGDTSSVSSAAGGVGGGSLVGNPAGQGGCPVPQVFNAETGFWYCPYDGTTGGDPFSSFGVGGAAGSSVVEATPTGSPTPSPTEPPTPSPTESPTAAPTPSPTATPTASPTTSPPTPSPTTSVAPSNVPTFSPTVSSRPSVSFAPSSDPTLSSKPSVEPTHSPSVTPVPIPFKDCAALRREQQQSNNGQCKDVPFLGRSGNPQTCEGFVAVVKDLDFDLFNIRCGECMFRYCCPQICEASCDVPDDLECPE